jgi:hypothetical protein
METKTGLSPLFEQVMDQQRYMAVGEVNQGDAAGLPHRVEMPHYFNLLAVDLEEMGRRNEMQYTDTAMAQTYDTFPFGDANFVSTTHGGHTAGGSSLEFLRAPQHGDDGGKSHLPGDASTAVNALHKVTITQFEDTASMPQYNFGGSQTASYDDMSIHHSTFRKLDTEALGELP